MSFSEANRDGADAEFPFPLFSLFLPHLRTLAHEKRPENWFVLGLVGPVSLSIIVAKYNLFPCADNGRSCEKKFLAKRFADAISEHCQDLEHAYVY